MLNCTSEKPTYCRYIADVTLAGKAVQKWKLWWNASEGQSISMGTLTEVRERYSCPGLKWWVSPTSQCLNRKGES